MLLGFDIGGTKCAVILGKNNGTDAISVIEKTAMATKGLAYEMIEAMFAAAECMLATNGLRKDSLSGIGICCGGPLNSKAGMILSPPNLPGWHNIAIVELAQQRFGVKAVLQNDANACAVAEWRYGAGIGYRNIVFLTFGTGMGAGLILNGQLYAGTTDLAGEAGHVRLADSGPIGFGKHGSFEGFCSGGGIAQLAQAKAKEILKLGKTVSFCKSMEELEMITAKSVAEAAYNGDEAAVAIYATSARYLGKGISILIDLLNPEVIVIGGIYSRAQELLEPGMLAVIEKEALPGAYSSCRILPALLGENIGDLAALALADMHIRQ